MRRRYKRWSVGHGLTIYEEAWGCDPTRWWCTTRGSRFWLGQHARSPTWGSLDPDFDNVAVIDVAVAVAAAAADNVAAAVVAVAAAVAVAVAGTNRNPHHPPPSFSSVYRVFETVHPVRRGSRSFYTCSVVICLFAPVPWTSRRSSRAMDDGPVDWTRLAIDRWDEPGPRSRLTPPRWSSTLSPCLLMERASR